MRRIGVLMGYSENDSEAQTRLAAFKQTLMALGWSEGRNLRIDVRWAASGDKDRPSIFAKELMTLRPEVILSKYHASDRSITSGDQDNSDRIRACIRSGPRGLRRELGAPRWQHHRFHEFRADDGRQMAGSAYGDHAPNNAGHLNVQS